MPAPHARFSTRSDRARSIAGTAARVTAAGAVAALGLATFSSPAGAHVSPDKTEVPAGGYTDIKLGVGHGCEASPTTKLEVQVPAEILNVTPYIVPGWDVVVGTETLDTPAEGSHGEQITERDATITWTAQPGNELADGYKMQFGISFQVPDSEGTSLSFPTIQTCQEGATDWIQIPVEGEDEPEEPAPTVMIVPSAGGGHGSADNADAGDDAAGDDAAADGDESATPVSAAGGDSNGSGDSDDDGSSNGLAIAGLVAGLGGLGLGGAAFAKSRG